MSVPIQLREGLRTLRLSLSTAQEQQLVAFQSLLAKWNAIYNLTAIREPERMITHHLLDSLAVLPSLPQRESLRMIDVGTGAGLPGIPLAIARPGWQIMLLDSNHKKTAFVQQALIELALSNVTVAAARAEAYQPQESFDVVISRAFADLAEFARLAGHLAKPGGLLVAMKGVHPYEELATLPEPWKALPVERLSVPGLDADRHVVKLLKAA